MKSLIAVMALLVITCNASAQTNLPGTASIQTNSSPLFNLGTNFLVIPFGIFNTSTKHFGGGLAAAKELNQNVSVGARMDYIDGQVWMPSMNLQIQIPVRVGPVTVVPFAFSGAATPLGGNQSGSAVGMAGAGAAIRVSSHWDGVFDIEHWTGTPGAQIRAGLIWRFWSKYTRP